MALISMMNILPCRRVLPDIKFAASSFKTHHSATDIVVGEADRQNAI
jgi:hypothetical protein